jgi:uncharacterized SAM-binding protein YcdF (DUF218 family)
MSDRKWIYLLVIQGLAMLALAAVIAVLQLARTEANASAGELSTLLLEPRYEYKVVVLLAGGSLSRTGADAMKASSVEVDEKELSKLGSQGWELVGSFLENETAYPNFGDDKYVTGLQTNVRPQRLVLLLRHRIG